MNDRFLEDLKNRIDIVEIVRRYAPDLKKSGKNYMCRSPLRNERSPSFCVSPDKQFWYDFGVSEGGDVVSFIEKIENVSFREAVETLADIAGIEMPSSFGKESVSKEKKKDLFDLHEKAAEFFMSQLQSSSKPQAYLKDRGVSDEIAKEWKLGYGGDAVDGLTKFLLQSGFTHEQIQDSGVAFERSFGEQTMRDRFDHRLMVPICEPRNGKIIAFTGRDLSGEKGKAKYVNSPENPVYHKSSTLFGLDRARNPIRDMDQVLLVEGNFDVIAAHSIGLTQTVATCGTSLTEEHLRILKRFTRRLYLAFDNDLAGKKATLRAVEMILKMELEPFVVEIKGGKDLDDLAQKDPEKLKTTVTEAKSALAFFFEKFAAKNLDGTLEGEKKFLDSFFYFLKLVPRPIEIDTYLKQVASKLNRAPSVINQEFEKYQKKAAQAPTRIKRDRTKKQTFSRAQAFVGFLSSHWDVFGPKLHDQPDSILDILPELERTFLEKKIENVGLSEEENQILMGWEMAQSNLYETDSDPTALKRDFQTFAQELKKDQDALHRIERARNLEL